MAKPLFTNNAYSTLASGINSTATTLTVATGEGARFPTVSGSDYFYVTLIDTSNNMEIVKVTARSTDTFTIVRGQDGTSGTAFSASDRVELRPTAASIEEAAAGGYLDGASIPDDTIVTANITDANITTAKIADANVTKTKIENLSDYTVLGNVSGGAAAPAEVTILDEDDMSSDSATALPTQQSVKAYVDGNISAGGATGLSEVVEFTSSGTFSKGSYTDAVQFIVTVIGPGGDGGNADTGGGGHSGGGGGGGGVAIKRFVPGDLASSVTVTINSSLASFVHSTAVTGNTGADASSENGGAGGTATGGDQNYAGQAGGNGRDTVSSTDVDGAAGGSVWGGYGHGGQGGMRRSNAKNGHGYGGGGGGQGMDSGGTTGSAGSGAAGAVIVEVRY
jgi:hypothetical protein